MTARVLQFLAIPSLAAAVLLAFRPWDPAVDAEFSIKWAAVVTIITAVIAPAWYFWTEYRNRRGEQSRTSQNLGGELEDTLDALDVGKHPESLITVTNEDTGETASFMNRTLNTDFYTSFVHSGRINFLARDVQQRVQDMFKLIAKHNHYDLLLDMSDKDRKNPENFKYYKWMESAENRLRKEGPGVVGKLKKYY